MFSMFASTTIDMQSEETVVIRREYGKLEKADVEVEQYQVKLP